MNPRHRAILTAMLVGPIMDDSMKRQFYRLGGHGFVNIRYNAETLRAMVDLGLAEREGRIYSITTKGRESVA